MINILNSIKMELMILLFSMVPIIELRGAIPLGISLGLHPIHSGILGIIGNISIGILLLKALRPLMNYFEKTELFRSSIGWVKKRSMKKAGTIKKYSLVGLFFFVAIPIPTSGVWTASLIATILKLDRRRAMITMSLGVIVSAIIVLGIYYGIFKI